MMKADQGLASEARSTTGEDVRAAHLTLRAPSRRSRPSSETGLRPITTLSEGIGEAIRRRRVALRIERKELAACLRSTTSAVCRVERGRHAFTVATLQEYAHHLRCQVTRLVSNGEKLYARSKLERGLR